MCADRSNTSHETRRPRQARSRLTIEKILDATADILVESGFESLNTNSVARRAGVNVATLYAYFTDKFELIKGLADRLNAIQLEFILGYLESGASGLPADTDSAKRDRIFDRAIALREQQPWIIAMEDACFASPQLMAMREAALREVAENYVNELDIVNMKLPAPQRVMAMRLVLEVAASAMRLIMISDKQDRPFLKQEFKRLIKNYLDDAR